MIKPILGFFEELSDIGSGKSTNYVELGDFAGIWLKGILVISSIIALLLYVFYNSAFPFHYMIGIVAGTWSLLILVLWLRAQSYHVAQQRYFNKRITTNERKNFSTFGNVHNASRNKSHPRHEKAMNVKRFIRRFAYDNTRGGSGGGGSIGGRLVGNAMGAMLQRKKFT